MSPTRALPVFASLLLCPIAIAQYTAGKVIFKNPGSFTQADLEAVAAIHTGEKTSTPNIQAAAQRLIDTGYFEDVGAEPAGPVAALNITFVLKPIAPSRMTAVGFENFVWLTPDELSALLHKAAPLFHGQLPDAGNQVDSITAALQAALAAKGIAANVTRETLEPSMNQPVRAMEFRVDQPVVRVHAIDLQGVAPEVSAAVAKTTARLRGNYYSEGLNGENTAALLLIPYLDAGFLDAHLAHVERHIVQSTPADVGIDFTASAEPGLPYRVASITFAGTPLIASAPVMSAAKLHTGDIASRRLLLETLAPIDAAYRRQGYMDVFVDAGAKLDTAAHTVSYDIQVTPGEQYRLRSVTPLNLSPEARKDFDSGWRLKPGELYDPLYAADFLKNNTALRSLQGYAAVFEASADPQTHQVDLTIKFARLGSK